MEYKVLFNDTRFKQVITFTKKSNNGPIVGLILRVGVIYLTPEKFHESFAVDMETKTVCKGKQNKENLKSK